MSKYIAFKSDNGMMIREVNPYHRLIFDNDFDPAYINPKWEQFEERAIANAKPAAFECNPGDRFEDGEIELVWQFSVSGKNWIKVRESEYKKYDYDFEKYRSGNKRIYTRQAFIRTQSSEANGLNLDKLGKEIDDLIDNSTAESYNKVFEEIDKDMEASEPKQPIYPDGEAKEAVVEEWETLEVLAINHASHVCQPGDVSYDNVKEAFKKGYQASQAKPERLKEYIQSIIDSDLDEFMMLQKIREAISKPL